MNQRMHISEICIHFFLYTAYIPNIRVRLVLFCEVEGGIVSFILGLYKRPLKLPCVLRASWILEMNHIITPVRKFSEPIANDILYEVKSFS